MLYCSEISVSVCPFRKLAGKKKQMIHEWKPLHANQTRFPILASNFHPVQKSAMQIRQELWTEMHYPRDILVTSDQDITFLFFNFLFSFMNECFSDSPQFRTNRRVADLDNLSTRQLLLARSWLIRNLFSAVLTKSYILLKRTICLHLRGLFLCPFAYHPHLQAIEHSESYSLRENFWMAKETL